MVKLIGITRALALSGCTDFSFVDEESKWKGSEVHRIVELQSHGTLDAKSIPAELAGYAAAHRKFMRETRFIPQQIEHSVSSKTHGLRGRIDAAGLMRGKVAIVDFKTGQINPAVALQLCLGGFCLNETMWFQRYAVRLDSDGRYCMTCYDLRTWRADLSTALSAVRIARWKVANGLVK